MLNGGGINYGADLVMFLMESILIIMLLLVVVVGRLNFASSEFSVVFLVWRFYWCTNKLQ
jgi:hypothetical protein